MTAKSINKNIEDFKEYRIPRAKNTIYALFC